MPPPRPRSLYGHSPPLVLRRLCPDPRPLPVRPVPSFDFVPAQTAPSSSRVYPGTVEKPFTDPHEALWHSYNVAEHSLEIAPGKTLPEELNVPVLRDAHMPTHVLAITDAPVLPRLYPDPAPIYPILAPINAEVFATKFSNDVAQLSSQYTTPGSLMPVPHWDETTRTQVVRLPVLPLVAPHPASLPLLIFYGMGLHHDYEPIFSSQPSSPGSPLSDHSQFRPSSRRRSHETTPLAGSSTGLLATYLLPLPVIEEYPAATAMAEKMCDICTDEELVYYAEYNRGFWRNVLSLAPTDTDIIDIARLAWNVTKEARWIRGRFQDTFTDGVRSWASLTHPPPSPT
ncbi:hypothetical protein BXZ70DRAFT_1006739 [Cristinia sonorae]|uniref:Uncharacterized protein n=1 Tax=Cristinia sonorae TaxID=1940300 RepID=A0A8K0XRD5_9AGAR|nr:hypothetical protein BXZ70DRAFT_1006739 [Cristinia sonorae]